MRLLVAGLAVIGLVSLFSGGAGAVAGVGLLILAPLFFVMKIALFMMLFGLFARGVSHHRYHRGGRQRAEWAEDWAADWSDWRSRHDRNSRRSSSWAGRRSRVTSQGPSDTERFEELHRMAHARAEVDSWVDPQVEPKTSAQSEE